MIILDTFKYISFKLQYNTIKKSSVCFPFFHQIILSKLSEHISIGYKLHLIDFIKFH